MKDSTTLGDILSAIRALHALLDERLPAPAVDAGEQPDICRGFWRIDGATSENSAAHLGHVYVRLNDDGTGRQALTVWGLSLYDDGDGPTWAYRTLGISLSEMLERWPRRLWSRSSDMEEVLRELDRAREQPTTPDLPPGWVRHDGGPNPVPGRYIDGWMLRDGRRIVRKKRSRLLVWYHDGGYSDIIAYLPVAEQEPERCWCYSCADDYRRMSAFIACPDCGNKRCPRATNHRHACTGSNEPDQPGSRYSTPTTDPRDEAVAALAEVLDNYVVHSTGNATSAQPMVTSLWVTPGDVDRWRAVLAKVRP